MAIKIGINGFGRIGRLVFRAAVAQPESMRSSASTIRLSTWITWSIW